MDWELANWEVVQMKKLEINQSLCKGMHIGPLLVPEHLNALDAKQFCHKINGKMFVVDNDHSRNLASSLRRETCQSKSFNNTVAYVWSGWNDEVIEGNYVNVESSKTTLDETNFTTKIWAHSEPNGDQTENCIGIDMMNGLFYDMSCQSKYCSICDVGTSPIFNLRGLCKDSTFDSYYGWTGEMSDGKYNFRGFTSSFIFWDKVNKLWKITNTRNQSIYATSKGNKDGYSMGVNLWNIYNDTCGQEGETDKTLELSFTSCQEDSFNCLDGTWYKMIIFM